MKIHMTKQVLLPVVVVVALLPLAYADTYTVDDANCPRPSAAVGTPYSIETSFSGYNSQRTALNTWGIQTATMSILTSLVKAAQLTPVAGNILTFITSVSGMVSAIMGASGSDSDPILDAFDTFASEIAGQFLIENLEDDLTHKFRPLYEDAFERLDWGNDHMEDYNKTNDAEDKLNFIESAKVDYVEAEKQCEYFWGSVDFYDAGVGEMGDFDNSGVHSSSNEVAYASSMCYICMSTYMGLATVYGELEEYYHREHSLRSLIYILNRCVNDVPTKVYEAVQERYEYITVDDDNEDFKDFGMTILDGSNVQVANRCAGPAAGINVGGIDNFRSDFLDIVDSPDSHISMLKLANEYCDTIDPATDGEEDICRLPDCDIACGHMSDNCCPIGGDIGCENYDLAQVGMNMCLPFYYYSISKEYHDYYHDTTMVHYDTWFQTLSALLDEMNCSSSGLMPFPTHEDGDYTNLATSPTTFKMMNYYHGGSVDTDKSLSASSGSDFVLLHVSQNKYKFINTNNGSYMCLKNKNKNSIEYVSFINDDHESDLCVWEILSHEYVSTFYEAMSQLVGYLAVEGEKVLEVFEHDGVGEDHGVYIRNLESNSFYLGTYWNGYKSVNKANLGAFELQHANNSEDGSILNDDEQHIVFPASSFRWQFITPDTREDGFSNIVLTTDANGNTSCV